MKKLDYLGRILAFSVPNQVSFVMESSVLSMVAEFEELETLKKPPNTPAAEHLFEIKKASRGEGSNLPSHDCQSPLYRQESKARYPDSGGFPFHKSEGAQ